MIFLALKRYLRSHNELKGGLVRYDEKCDMLLIFLVEYDDNFEADTWAPIEEALPQTSEVYETEGLATLKQKIST